MGWVNSQCWHYCWLLPVLVVWHSGCLFSGHAWVLEFLASLATGRDLVQHFYTSRCWKLHLIRTWIQASLNESACDLSFLQAISACAVFTPVFWSSCFWPRGWEGLTRTALSMLPAGLKQQCFSYILGCFCLWMWELWFFLTLVKCGSLNPLHC